jgi:hypothetical protein
MPDRPAPVLLAAFAAGALAVAEAVAWIGRTQSAWLDVVAVVLMLALLAAIGTSLGRVLAESGEGPRRTRRAATGLGVIAAVALLAGAAPFVVPALARAGLDGPEAAVRGYVGAEIDGDGIGACRYLSGPARAYVEHVTGQDCESYYGSAAARVGDRVLTGDSQLAGARYSETARGRDRIVTMRYDGTHGRFVLTPATAAERAAYLAPPVPWRIAKDEGVAAAV